MEQKELLEVLEKHVKWLRRQKGGKRAVLDDARLMCVSLNGLNLSYASLRGTDLHGIELRGTNLYGADIDYSSWPLWCGSLKARIDDRQARQLLYHVLSAVAYSDNCSDNLKATLLTKSNIAVANQFHRVDECGKLKIYEKGDNHGNDHN